MQQPAAQTLCQPAAVIQYAAQGCKIHLEVQQGTLECACLTKRPRICIRVHLYQHLDVSMMDT